MEQNDKKKYNRYRIVVLLLIIIIIILLLLFWKKSKENGIILPTGNIDVFDIDVNIEKIGKNNGNNIDYDTIESSNNNEEVERKIYKFNLSTDANTLDRVFVDDVNGDYIYQQKLDIFNNATFHYTNKIAPGVSNTYKFVVHNSSDVDLNYKLEMYEDTEYKVNLKYRLKKNNVYVIGNDNNWVTANELNTELARIKDGGSDNYSLDWKWFDDDKNDTIIGKNMTSVYKLNVRFRFEAVNE